MVARTDRNNNPAAFTTDIARQAGLIQGVDFVFGDSFIEGNNTYYTAKLLGDPIELTIRVIDTITFYNRLGHPRWDYISIPPFIWDLLNKTLRTKVIGFMYSHEGGTELKHYFEA